MDSRFNPFSCIFNKKSKVKPVINETITIKNNQEYYELHNNIRVCKKLSENELEFIKTLPRENLIDIINMYDIHMGNLETFNNFYTILQ